MNKLLVMSATTLAVLMSLKAETEMIGGYTWTYQINGATANIYNNGSAAISPSPTGAVTIPSTLGGKPVTSIGERAFLYCSGLTSVTIGNGVTSIGSSAFHYCSGLTSVTIPDSVTSIGSSAFYYCSGLTSVTIPDSVTSIGSQAFSGCSGLTSVTIPNSVTSIGSSAFHCCSGLTSVTIGNGVTNIGGYAFYGCTNLTGVYITDLAKWCGISFDGSSANPLYYAHNLYLNGGKVTDLVIPDSVTSIGNYAFSGCSGLTSMKFPGSVREIGESALANCRGLTNVIISSGVESIGYGVFAGCASLQKLTVPFVGAMREWANYVSAPDSYAYSIASTLERKYPSGGNLGHMFGQDAFDGSVQISQKASGLYRYYIPIAGGAGGTSGTNMEQKTVGVYLPTSLTEIVVTDAKGLGYGAFSGCFMLKSITLSEGMTTIEEHAFNGCTGLRQLTIPNGVTTLGDNAFSGCSGLARLTLPSSVQYIGNAAFSGCGGLKWLSVPQCVCGSRMSSVFPAAYATIEEIVVDDGATGLGASVFEGCTGLKSVTVPSSVTSIGADAFRNCSNLGFVRYRGNAPDVGSSIYWGTPRTFVSHVPAGSVGWMGDVTSTDLPEMWNERAIAWYSLPEMTPAEALNVSALRLAMSGDASWYPDNTESHDGEAAMRSGAVGDGGETRMEATVRGAGTLSFWWKVSSESFKGLRIDHVSFEIDGEERAWMGGEEGWTNMMFAVSGDGEHTFSWIYRKDAEGGAEGADCAWVDEVRWVGNVSSVDEALDAVGMSFATGGDAAWRLDYDAGCADAVSMRSGPIGDGQVSWIETSVVGPGTAAFSWKTSSETYKSYQVDYLSFEVDGEEKEWVGGETDWRRVSVAVTGSGTHTLRWTYRKDPTDFAGRDCGWLDAVSWTPDEAASGLGSWLAERNLTADSRAANGRTAAECYALGLDPALATNDFRIVSIEMVDGEPKVEWEPKTNRWTGAEIKATLKGAAELKGPWAEVPAGGGSPGTARPAMQFFKVTVEGQ